MIRFMKRLTGILLGIGLCAGMVSARPIAGSHRVKLTTPVTKEISALALVAAKDSFLVDIVSWIEENHDVIVDSQSSIVKYHLRILASELLPSAKQISRFEGKEWSYSITCEEELLITAIAGYNERCDAGALNFWKLANDAAERHEVGSAYTAGIATLFYAMGHFGTPMPSPRKEANLSLIDDARQNMMGIFGNMSISVDKMIITGKLGLPVTEYPIVSARLDTIPLVGIPLRVLMQGGKELIAIRTDENGNASLEGVSLPFVIPGTFFTIVPDLGKFIHVPCTFTGRDLGVQNASTQEQMIIVKVVPSTYKLTYTARSVSSVVVPADFSAKGSIDRYLMDSCFLKQATESQTPDFLITATVQASQYDIDASESTILKTEGRITITRPASGKNQVFEGVMYQQSFERGTDIPSGVFFWQASTTFKRTLKKMIGDI